MRKILFFLLCLITLSVTCQIEKNSNFGIGTGGGIKMCYGAWGVFGNYSFERLKNKIEFNTGLGIRQAPSYGLGIKIKLMEVLKRIEFNIGINYSFQSKGKFRFESKNLIDYYNTSPTQYFHYFLSSRFFLDKFACIQLDLGYTQNISGINFSLISGPNENTGRVINTLNSGAMIGIDLIVFLKFKKGN